MRSVSRPNRGSGGKGAVTKGQETPSRRRAKRSQPRKARCTWKPLAIASGSDPGRSALCLIPGAYSSVTQRRVQVASKPNPYVVPQRRLALWRKSRCETGEVSSVVFVSLSGEILKKPQCFAAAKQDMLLLQALRVKNKGPKSCILYPELTPPFSDDRSSSDTDLTFWCLPGSVIRTYASLGVDSLYTWQAQCLHMAFPDVQTLNASYEATGHCEVEQPREPISKSEKLVRDKKSLVYSAPTSGGKSLVAELIMLRNLLFEGVRSIFVVPHVSLCNERLGQMRHIADPLALRVEQFHANANSASLWYGGVDISICTLEKANLIFNRLIQDEIAPRLSAKFEDIDACLENCRAGLKSSASAGYISVNSSDCGVCYNDRALPTTDPFWDVERLPEDYVFPVGLVCVDELHFLGDDMRGFLVELLLSKIVFLNKVLPSPIQVVGMSATLPNVKEIASWLNAEVFVTNSRPSPLSVFVKSGRNVYTYDRENGVSGLANLRSHRHLHDGRVILPHPASASTLLALQAINAASMSAASKDAICSTGEGAGSTHAHVAAGALIHMRGQSMNRASSVKPSGATDWSSESHCLMDEEHIGALVWETLREGKSVIVFCPTKEWCVRTASFLVRAIAFYRRADAWNELIIRRCHQEMQMGCNSVTTEELRKRARQMRLEIQKTLQTLPILHLAQLLIKSRYLYTSPQVVSGREELRWQLKQDSVAPWEELDDAVAQGVAFHHAGLTSDERRSLERAYHRGYVRVLCATSTLALGVNLPASRVVIRSPHVGKDQLTAAKFWQMAGRAGRKGLEEKGEAYLVCSASELLKVGQLLSSLSHGVYRSNASECKSEASSTEVTSCMHGTRLCRLVLEAVHLLIPLIRHTSKRDSNRETALRCQGDGYNDPCASRLHLTSPATHKIEQSSCANGKLTFRSLIDFVLSCTLRGRQEAKEKVIREVVCVVHYLHLNYLVEFDVSCKAAAVDSVISSAVTRFTTPLEQDTEGSRSSMINAFLQKAPTDAISGDDEDGHKPQQLQFPCFEALSRALAMLPPQAKTLIRQYPCLRSPVVAFRFLFDGEASFYAPQYPRSADPGSRTHSPMRRICSSTSDDHVQFISGVEFNFKSMKHIHGLFNTNQMRFCNERTLSATAFCGDLTDDRLEGLIATTTVGAAAVEAGLAPHEAVELFADVFKAMMLGLCAASELHLLFLAAISMQAQARICWRTYLRIYDALDYNSIQTANFLGISRTYLVGAAIEGGRSLHIPNLGEVHDLWLSGRLNIGELQQYERLHTHRRFFLALLLFDVYRRGESYERVMQRFGVHRGSVLQCVTQGPLMSATLGCFVRVLQPQYAAFAEVCFLLAEKFRAIASPIPVLMAGIARSAGTSQNPSDGNKFTAVQDLCHLHGMNARRIVALHAASIRTTQDLAAAEMHEIYKALEAGEPAVLSVCSNSTAVAADAAQGMRHQQQARLFAVAARLKEAALSAIANQMQALEDEAASNFVLAQLDNTQAPHVVHS